MNKTFSFKSSLVVAALSVLAFGTAQAATMSKDEYSAAKSRIGTAYKADKATCDAQAGNAKDVCVEQAKGKDKVALAELEFAYSGKAADQNKVLVTRAETTYAVAKERCDDRSGNAKDVCVSEAKAVETKSLAEAKMGKEIGKAEKEAGTEMRDADRKVAMEKCDALAGDAKTSCVKAAEARYVK